MRTVLEWGLLAIGVSVLLVVLVAIPNGWLYPTVG